MTHTLLNRQDEIRQIIYAHEGMLPVTHVEALLSEYNLTEDQLLLALLPILKKNSIVPISDFRVSGIAVGATGNFYPGSNIELANAPLNLAVHSEQGVIVLAHLHGETGITKIISSEKPCGHCRQFINELTGAGSVEILLPDGHKHKISQLLPHAFGPKELGIEGLLLSRNTSKLILSESENDDLTSAALQAADASYSPYAKSHAGAALRVKNGKIYRGSYIENAAFNPSVPPVQSALVHLVQSGETFADLTEAVLVQEKGTIINHMELAVETMKSVNSSVTLRLLEAARN